MKKNFFYYFCCWFIVFIAFNVLSFVIPDSGNSNKFSTSFWIGYSFMIFSFLLQFLCSFLYFRSKNNTIKFLNLSIVKISLMALILSFAISVVIMYVPSIPAWASILIEFFLSLFFVVILFASNMAKEKIISVDEEINENTVFIKSLTMQSKNLYLTAKSKECKDYTKEVYDAFHYSEPLSNDSVLENESKIKKKFEEFSNLIENDLKEKSRECSRELISLIEVRNNQLRFLINNKNEK